MLTIERGEHGLFYATDPDAPGIFIAGLSEEEVRRRAEAARACFRGEGTTVEGHEVCRHPSGARVTVPAPEWQSVSQALETLDRLEMELLRAVTPAGRA